MDYRNPHTEYRGKKFDVLTFDTSHPREEKFVRKEVITHPGAAAILPFLTPQTILLIRNDRPCVQQTLWEIPAGTLDPNEQPQECALRELQEESGYRAALLKPLCQFFPSPGICNEVLYCFTAHDLTFVGQDLNETEKIEVIETPFTQALEMIRTGQIIDSKTIVSLLYYAQFQN